MPMRYGIARHDCSPCSAEASFKECEMIQLYHGDCRHIIMSEKIDLSNVIVVTDPPFNIGYHYKTYRDRMKQNEYMDMLASFIRTPAVVIHYPEALHGLSVRGGGDPIKGCQLVLQFKFAKATQRYCVL